MKTKALFAATLIGIGALAAQAMAADPVPADRGAVADRAGAEAAREHRGGKHQRHHRGQRFAHAGGGFGIARLDTDGDGRISRVELEQAAQARQERAGRRGEGPRRMHGMRGGGWLLENFDAIDANRDGHIVRAELRAWHEAQRPQREAERERRFQQRFDAADLNGDGLLGRVEVQEKMPRLAASFNWLDENGDGFLSREELRPRR